MNSAHLGGNWFVNVFYNIKYSTINYYSYKGINCACTYTNIDDK